MKYHVEVCRVVLIYTGYELFVGSSKDSLTSKVNPDLAVNAVVLEFGKFMKIIVCFSEDVRLIQAKILMHLIF